MGMISPKMQKVALAIILVFLFLFLPLGGYGLYLKLLEKPIDLSKENVDHEMFFDGKLWFYNSRDEILGTYTCQNSYCSYGKSYAMDFMYPIDSYHSETDAFLPVIQDQFVFIHDSNDPESHEVFLYDIQNNYAFKDNMYSSINNYEVGIGENLYIVEDLEHHFGLLQVSFLTLPIIAPSYDFLGIVGTSVQGDVISADYLVGKKGDEWVILDRSQAIFTSNILEPIVTYNGEYIITKVDSFYHVMNYMGEKLFDIDFKDVSFFDRFILCRTMEDEFFIYDNKTQENLSESYFLEEADEVTVELNSSGDMDIKINGEVRDTISLT